jgi:hypothetical protein
VSRHGVRIETLLRQGYGGQAGGHSVSGHGVRIETEEAITDHRPHCRAFLSLDFGHFAMLNFQKARADLKNYAAAAPTMEE